MKLLLRLGVFVVVLIVDLLIMIYAAFGRGVPYADISTEPLLPQSAIEAAVVADRPIRNATVSAHRRICYTVHPESNPNRDCYCLRG
ncbi:hypothetical protein WG622_16645 [Cognatishimia sp. D5M38]|uniref:Uncharacterized protein n=1 Tax=Cognatishimia coralii TaxID=3083254 RepID=A0ABU8QKC9_9RHOB